MNEHAGKKRKAVRKLIHSIASPAIGARRITRKLAQSEEKYRAAFEYTGTGMMVLEEDMVISLINRKMCELTGYPREEIEGKRPWTELVCEEDLGRMVEYHRARRHDPSAAPAQYEFRYKHVSGTLHHALITVSMIPGSPRSLVSLMDISALKETAKKLMESQDRFKDTAELLPGIICEISRDMKFLYVNKIGLEMFGYSLEEFERGIELPNVVHPDDLGAVIANAARVMKGETIGAHEYRLIHKNGDVREVMAISSRMTADGEVIGIRSCVVDISERKRIERRLLESEERFRSVYSASPIGIALFDLHGAPVDMNDSFCAMFGLLRDVSCVNVDFRLFEHLGEVKEGPEDIVRRGGVRFESRKDFTFAKNRDRYECIPTEKRILDWHITPLGVEGASVVLILAQVQDVTERRKSEEAKLREAQKAAAEANRMVEGLRRELYQSARFGDMVSRSPAMQELFAVLPEIAQASTTVLVTGESGTGKELVARSIHDMSPRKGKPFVAINCGALPDALLESELFGYKAGAFTDAKKDKPGKFAQADGGTIFLDEIGDVSPAMQVKLLRVLQERVVEPLGAVKPATVDVRIVAATNRNLTDMVKVGSFREDLYYRIKVLTLELPPLRDRKADIPLLCDHFISLFNARYNKSVTELSREALDALLAHDFPGNIRELENILERAFIFCKGGVIECAHLPPEIAGGKSAGSEQKNLFAGITNFEELEKQFLTAVLAESGGSRIEASRRLGIHKATLFRKIKSLGIATA